MNLGFTYPEARQRLQSSEEDLLSTTHCQGRVLSPCLLSQALPVLPGSGDLLREMNILS